MFYIVLGFISKPLYAAPIGADVLISNCKEFVAIYDRKGEEQLLAGLSTSVSEAMRAGVCRGIIEEHKNHDSNCDVSAYTIANSIAAAVYVESVEYLLVSACQ